MHYTFVEVVAIFRACDIIIYVRLALTCLLFKSVFLCVKKARATNRVAENALLKQQRDANQNPTRFPSLDTAYVYGKEF